MVIGSRMLRDRAIAGGMPRWKWLGNRLLTGIENRAFGVSLSEYHTGYRAFSAELLRSIPFLRNSDDFVFDQQIFAQVLARGARVVEVPIPTRYFLEASSVDLPTSIRYGVRPWGCSGASWSTAAAAAGRCCAEPPATSAPSARSHAQRTRRRDRRAARRRGARAAHRLRRRDARTTRCATTPSTTTSMPARSPRARGSPRPWPTAARRPSARPATRTSWAPCTTCSRPIASPRASACGSRGSRRPSWGRRSSRWWACSRRSCGDRSPAWWRSGWRRSTCP